MNSIFDIKSKIALVTGSTQGLGYTLAVGLAEAGCTVILNGRDEVKLNEVAAEFKNKGFNTHAAAFDVTDEQVMNNKIREIEKNIGPIDILVNNAGIQIRGPLEEFKLSDWQRIMDTNLTGVFLVSKAVVKGMMKRKSGKIINICSVQSELARPSIAPYTASKGGVKNLTRGMAAEWAKYNIQINGIAPGYFKTKLTKALYTDEKFDTWLRGRTPANRWGEPEELIGSLIFLSSKASDYINGHLIYVDGGMVTCV